MRIPEESTSKLFKCVKCGAIVERFSDREILTKSDEIKVSQKAPEVPSGSEALLRLFVSGMLIQEDQRRQALAEHQKGKEKIFETLIRLGIISAEQFYAFMVKESSTASINLQNFTIDRKLTDLLPGQLVAEQWVLPIDKLGRSLTVAMVCPVDAEAISTVEHYSGLRLRPLLCTIDDFQKSFRKHYRVADAEKPSLPKAPATAVTTPTIEPQKQASQVSPVDQALLVETLSIPHRIATQVDATVGVRPGGLRQLVSVIHKCPPLGAKLLSVANSQAFALPGYVDSIPMAVALLGDEAVSVIVTAIPKYPAALERQWASLNRYSRTVAEIAAVLASLSGRVAPATGYCAGLLHGIGSYALGEIMPDEYRKIDPGIVAHERCSAEEKILGVGHDKMGETLCRAWKLPEVFCEVAGSYLEPSRAGLFRDCAEVVFLAAQLATPDGGLDPSKIHACSDSLSYLHLDANETITTLQTKLQVHVGQDSVVES